MSALASKCALARAETYVIWHNLSLYTKVFIIRYDICLLVDICMYTKRF